MFGLAQSDHNWHETGTSICSRLQHFYRPDVKYLENHRIDELYEFDMNDEEESSLKWCQGEVISVYDDHRRPTVRLLWGSSLMLMGVKTLLKVIRYCFQYVGARTYLVHGEWMLSWV